MVGLNYKLPPHRGRFCKERKYRRGDIKRLERELAAVPADQPNLRRHLSEVIARKKRQLEEFNARAERWHRQNPGHEWRDPRARK